MGHQDQRFPETEAELVTGSKGTPRYYKRFNAKGNRKFSTYRVKPGQRTHGNAFSDFPDPTIAGKSEQRSD